MMEQAMNVVRARTQMAINHIIGTSPLMGSPLDRADCNGDSGVNILDALFIKEEV